MKYKLEIQNNGFNIEKERIIKEVKDSLKNKKVVLSKIKDLEIYFYYVVDKKIIYYNGLYKDETVKGEIYVY